MRIKEGKANIMPTSRRQIVENELKKANINKAKMARLLGFNHRESFYRYFDVENFDLELFNKVMAKLTEMGAQIDNSIYNGSSITIDAGGDVGDTAHTMSKGGTPDSIVQKLLTTIERDNRFYQREISEKSEHLKVQGQSLIEKNETIKALIKELAIISKQNEEARTMLINKLDTIYEYIKTHDDNCKRNHKNTLGKINKEGNKN